MTDHLSRRSFAKLAGTAALGASNVPLVAHAAQAATLPAQASRSFPAGFLWGTATASYQVEGAVAEDGRLPSIWDTFSHTPGKVANNANGDVADDHYHRYKDDVQLMKALGVKAYRFSIAWPRVFPNGSGAPNPKGLDFYNRLVDELLANGIQPFATLYHWDLPQALQDRGGGWESRETAEAFGKYAGHVARHLTDRVRHIFTINEFGAFMELGYNIGIHAPGLKLPPKRFYQARHNGVLGHGLAVQAIRANGKSGTKVGLAENLVVGVPVIENAEHIAAAEKATRDINAQYLTVIMEGKYTDAYVARMGADAPRVTAEDLKIISSPLDFVGTNIYQPTFVRADTGPSGYAVVPNPPSYPHMISPWLFMGPEVLYWGPHHVAKLWNVKEIYITENGTSSSDVPAEDGKVYDTDRIMYLRNYISQLQRAVADGVPVKGYFLWSLMDNFEWADGYGNRFGLHYVDYATQRRTPKLSAEFYREVIARNAVA
ncbi:MAG TPA: GH1 family beta-glucosidase [Gemmatimonadaceae bacterium]|nr:GH1 family beta-glucosidase [Gemmatimonadaceae bacterium]